MAKVNTSKGEEKAYPDWFIIKREVLWSFFECSRILGLIYNSNSVNKSNNKFSLRFETELVRLFYKSKNLIKGDKRFKELEKIDDYVLKGKRIPIKEAMKFYSIMTDMLDKRGMLDLMIEEEDIGF